MSEKKMKYAWLSGWAKGGLNALIDEEGLESGLCVSGKVKFTKEQADDLIAFMADGSNFGEYGAELDFALFYEEADGNYPCFRGSISPVFVAEKKPERTTRARRSL